MLQKMEIQLRLPVVDAGVVVSDWQELYAGDRVWVAGERTFGAPLL